MKIPSRFPGAEETLRKRLRGRTLSLRLSLCWLLLLPVCISLHPLSFLSAWGFDVYLLSSSDDMAENRRGQSAPGFEFQKSRPKYKKKDVEECMMIEDLADVAYLGKISWAQGSRESQVKKAEMLVHLYFSGTLHLT